MSEKENRIRAITKIYYSNPQIQKILFEFAKDREVVPRYYEGFGKRPDTVQYPNDIMGMVNKGATSFHASEEIWNDPLQIDSEMSLRELNQLRKSWDLLIDIDSPYLDYSKIAAKLIIQELEKHKIKNYGVKFSGSKGFHIIVPAIAFPESFQDKKTCEMFPEWPRAISEYLMFKISPTYNKALGELGVNYEAVQERTKLSKEDLTTIPCPNCGDNAKKGSIVLFKCDRCSNEIERPNPKLTKRKLKCIDPSCPGFLEVVSEKEFYFCENCGFSDRNKRAMSSKKVVHSKTSEKYSEDFKEEISASKLGSLDLVLVASRHLFRMPYSLHEKTSLASVVLEKSEIDNFVPKDANPLKIKIKNFYPDAEHGEARLLLSNALEWKSKQIQTEEELVKKRYQNMEFTPTDFSKVTEDMFPKPIHKLLKGLQNGRKRGLFILLTFLRSLNFSPEYINSKVREWNNKNDPPLKEGYVKSQIDWHLRQKKKILPPNYSNPSFYKDLNLLDSPPKYKNPLAEITRKIKKEK